MTAPFSGEYQIDHRHIALLFAHLTKALIDEFGSNGKLAALSASVAFGQDRGQEMRRIARKHGLKNDFVSYLCFSDINLEDHQLGVSKWIPHVEICIHKCGWHQCWLQNNLIDYGRLYCQVVDQAIMHGFNENFRFSLPQVLTDGEAKCCRFIYHDAHLNIGEVCRYIFLKTKFALLHKTFVKPFAVHYDNLLRSFRSEIATRFGKNGLALLDRVGENLCSEFPVLRLIHKQ
jgi:hypothetical protein